MVCRMAECGRFRRKGRSLPGAIHDRHTAAQRDRRADDGARAEQHPPGHPHPPGEARGEIGPLDSRDRSRRNRDPKRRGAGVAQAEEDPARFRAGALCGEGLGVAEREGQHHPGAAPPAGRLMRLGTHPFHDGRGLFALGPHCLRRAFPAGPHLPRQANGELVSGLADGPLGRGGHHEAGQRLPLPGALRARGPAGRIHFRSRRRGPRRSQATSRSLFIRRIPVMRPSSARTSGAR